MHRALVYTRTAQYRHDSIPAGVAVIDELGRHLGLAIDATEEPGAFTPQQLADCRVVVFLSTSGDVLTDEGRSAFGAWVRDGGGFVGHACTSASTRAATRESGTSPRAIFRGVLSFLSRVPEVWDRS